MCVPHLYCSVHYADLVTSPSSTPCWLAINTPGICCYPTVPNVGKVINVIIADWRNISYETRGTLSGAPPFFFS